MLEDMRRGWEMVVGGNMAGQLKKAVADELQAGLIAMVRGQRPKPKEEGVANTIPASLLAKKGIPIGLNGRRVVRLPQGHHRHKLVIGSTRSGKTTWAKRYGYYIAMTGEGLIFADNADGEAAIELHDALPDEAMDRVVFLDYGNKQYPIPIPQVAQAKDEDDRDAVVNQWTSFFIGNFGLEEQWMTRDLIRYACRAAFEQSDATVLEVILMATSPEYRSQVNIKDRETSAWWRRFASLSEARQQETAASFLRRTSDILGDSTARNILCQRPNPELNYRQWMDEGKIVIIRAPESLGPEVCRMVMALNMVAIWSAALSRDDTERGRRKPVTLIADEPQTWLSKNKDVLNHMYSKAAKYGLYIMAFIQSVEQMESTALLKVVAANRPDLILFETEQDEAKHFRSMLGKHTTRIEDMKKYHFLAAINGHEPFVAKSIGPLEAVADRTEMRATHSARFGRQKSLVADDIFHRRFGREEVAIWNDSVFE